MREDDTVIEAVVKFIAIGILVLLLYVVCATLILKGIHDFQNHTETIWSVFDIGIGASVFIPRGKSK